VNLSEFIVPKSDQLNAEDLLAGPKTVTIERVTAGTSEQPVNVHLVETPGRPYRPSKTMRRVMVACWGPDAALYVGRRMTLYRDPTVKFGGMTVGGIKISHLSHIDKRTTLALTETRGKRAPHVVEPLPDAPAPTPSVDWQAEIEACAGDQDALRALWMRARDAQAGPDVAHAIRAAVTAAQTVSDAAAKGAADDEDGVVDGEVVD
jgi:hypothetical protein